MTSRTIVLLAATGAIVAMPVRFHAQDQHQHPEQLGTVQFRTSCTGVEAEFNRAVALLHSFSFSAANQAFEAVLARDATCAMAYWGQALSRWGNPFAGQRPPAALVSGRTVIERGLSTGTPTPRERGYLDAVAALFAQFETVDQRTRTLAYERAMEAVARAHPDDVEAAIFYALAVTQTALPTDKSYAQQLKSVSILEPLFVRFPEHPGLAHYLIHARDVPALAPDALEAARRYAKIAPSAPHALHMPSHTFTRVGSWQESVDTNIASAAAATRDGVFAEALHALDYQVYAYLQMGMDRDARRILGETPAVFAKLDLGAMGGAAPAVAGLYAAAAIPARCALERGAWAEAAALPTRSTAFPAADALTHFTRAVGAARSGRPDDAEADLARLDALHARLGEMNEAYWAGQVRIQREVVAAWVAFARGQRAPAVDAMRQAAEAEDATDKSAISPGPLAPAREQLGELLLALDRPGEALAEFEAVMKKEPRRFRATYGAAKAASLTGDRARARALFGELLTIAATADDPGRPELVEARAAAR